MRSSIPFGGTVYPINPNRKNVLGIRAWPSLEALPQPVDLAVIVTPASTVPGVMRECAKTGVRGVIIISAGFKEVGPEGVKLEQEVLQIRGRGRQRGEGGEGALRRGAPGLGFPGGVWSRGEESG